MPILARITCYKLQCVICGGVWQSRQSRLPLACPKCGSARWNAFGRLYRQRRDCRQRTIPKDCDS